jgi:hypothetical protein
VDLSVRALWDRWFHWHSVSVDCHVLHGWERQLRRRDPCHHELWDYVEFSAHALWDQSSLLDIVPVD